MIPCVPNLAYQIINESSLVLLVYSLIYTKLLKKGNTFTTNRQIPQRRKRFNYNYHGEVEYLNLLYINTNVLLIHYLF